MIEIKYLKSEAGLDNCFELIFPLKDYIDESFFKLNKRGYAAELLFYISLFLKNGMFDGKREHCHQYIWSFHYDCIYNNEIEFTMVFDEDYDMVSFAIEEENQELRKDIAEHIKRLIEKKVSLEMVDSSKYLWE